MLKKALRIDARPAGGAQPAGFVDQSGHIAFNGFQLLGDLREAPARDGGGASEIGQL
jgi:hypothetical protein